MLVLVRHGQSEANAAGLLLGRADSPLTELGQRQATALGEQLASQPAPLRRIVTSPLRRALRTAEAIAASASARRSGEGVEVTVEDRFVELDYGELDETAPGDLSRGTWDRWRSDATWRPPGGETLAEVYARVAVACEELAAEAVESDIVIVSHVSPIKAAIIWALDGGLELSWRLSLGVASISRIAINRSSGPSLVSFNETSHLDGTLG